MKLFKTAFLASLFLIGLELSAQTSSPLRAGPLEPLCPAMDRVLQLPRMTPDQFHEHLIHHGPVDRILVSKSRKELFLLEGEKIVKSYPIALGTSQEGPKHFEGDRKTPEGLYQVDGKNPKSEFNLALHLNYPNAEDLAFAKAQNRSPGGQILVHGFPTSGLKRWWVQSMHPGNWTAGCIAVTDPEIREIYSLVQVGTTIEICPMVH